MTPNKSDDALKAAIELLKQDRVEPDGGVCLHMADVQWEALMSRLVQPHPVNTQMLEAFDMDKFVDQNIHLFRDAPKFKELWAAITAAESDKGG